MNETFRVSIITAVYNGQKFLDRYFENYRLKQYENVELIIIDGGSTDRSTEIIKAHTSVIHYWVSESDGGIYDAWNKGLKVATGDYIMFLGCDDVLLPQALNSYASFISKLDKPDQIDFISSRVQMVNDKGHLIRVKGWPFEWPLFLREMTVAHPGALHSRRFFEKYGLFNTEYKVVGDYELLLRAGKNLKAAFMDKVTVLMTEGGASDSIAAIKEHYRAVVKTAGHPAWQAGINATKVCFKFNFRKLLREYGVNVYLKKSKA